MAPEQMEGKPADARTDIWALGCVLYEMLTGERAFKGDSTISTIIAVTRDDPRPLHELVRDVPPEAEGIVQRCLRKSPELRYASASEVERRLQECRALVTASTSRTTVRDVLRQCRRPTVAIPVLALVLSLIGLSGWWWHRTSNIRWARTEALPG